MLPVLAQCIECIIAYDLIETFHHCLISVNITPYTDSRFHLSSQWYTFHITNIFLRQVTATIYYWIYVHTLKMMHCREVWYYSCIILLLLPLYLVGFAPKYELTLSHARCNLDLLAFTWHTYVLNRTRMISRSSRGIEEISVKIKSGPNFRLFLFLMKTFEIK